MQLTNQITEKLKKFLTDPHVTVTVTAVNSRRVYIIGEVARPGAFPLQPNMTVLQALTSAGGPSPYAKTTKIYMLRTENGVQTKVAFNYKEVVKGRSTEQNVTLKPGDTIVVP
jgi:polysaccharide export outer membrane protein